MLFKEERFTLKGHEIELRSAKDEDAEVLIDGLKEVCGETDFLLAYKDEINLTIEDEIKFIQGNNKSEGDGLVMAFVDGEYAGNASFNSNGRRRRFAHRGSIGIALKLRFTGLGLGPIMLERILEKMKECGLEQAELDVFATNARAIHVYEKLGFRECGRIPKAAKYDDGTYADEVHMVRSLIS